MYKIEKKISPIAIITIIASIITIFVFSTGAQSLKSLFTPKDQSVAFKNNPAMTKPQTRNEKVERKSNDTITKTQIKDEIGLPSLFCTDDISSFGALIQEINDTSNFLSAYIKKQFSPYGKKILDGSDPSIGVFDREKNLLINELNRLLKDPGLYDETRFLDRALRDTTKRLLLKNPEGKDRISLNRRLLEDAYPKLIKKTSIDKHHFFIALITFLITFLIYCIFFVFETSSALIGAILCGFTALVASGVLYENSDFSIWLIYVISIIIGIGMFGLLIASKWKKS